MAYTITNLRANPLGFGPYNISGGGAITVNTLDRHIDAAVGKGDISASSTTALSALTGSSLLVDTAIVAYAAVDGVLVDPGAAYTRAELRTNFATLAAHTKKVEQMLKDFMANANEKNF